MKSLNGIAGGERRRGKRKLAGIGGRRAGAAAIYLGCVASPPSLMDDVDASVSQISRNMLTTGDWVTPRLNGVVFFEKPPLYYWPMAISYKVFGVHDWAARIPANDFEEFHKQFPGYMRKCEKPFSIFHHFPTKDFQKSQECRQSSVFFSYIASFPSFGRGFDIARSTLCQAAHNSLQTHQAAFAGPFESMGC